MNAKEKSSMVDHDENGIHKSYECNCSFHHLGVEVYKEKLADIEDIVDYETTQLDQVYNSRASYNDDLEWVGSLVGVIEILEDRMKEMYKLEVTNYEVQKEIKDWQVNRNQVESRTDPEKYTKLSKNVYVKNKFLAVEDRDSVPIPPVPKYSTVEVMGGNLDYEDTSEYREAVQGEESLCPTGW